MGIDNENLEMVELLLENKVGMLIIAIIIITTIIVIIGGQKKNLMFVLDL